MRRISLYHLETLLWISRLGTFAAAADRLNTTQPAISARVKELEGQVGFELFQRAGRNMVLTARGRQLVEECEPLWASIERTLLHSARLSGTAGIVRIGTGEIVAATMLPPFLRTLQDDFPQASLEVDIDLSHNMLQKLLGAANDLIFVAGPVATPNVETAPVGSVDLVWVASPAVAGQAEAGPEALPIWLLHRHSPIHGLALSALEEAGVARPMIHICNNARMLIDLVAADAGLSLAPRPMVADKLVSGTLVQLWPELDRSIEFQIAIRRQERDPLVRALFDRAALLRIGV